MRHPIVYEAHQQEHQPDPVPQRSAWSKYPRAMTVKCSEVACLRRAFNVALPAAEEVGWDSQGGHTSRGQAQVIDAAVQHDRQEVTSIDAGTPALPASSREWTVESALAYIVDARKPRTRREKLAKWVLHQATDLTTLIRFYNALETVIECDGASIEQVYADRYEELGGSSIDDAEASDQERDETPLTNSQREQILLQAAALGWDEAELDVWCEQRLERPVSALTTEEARGVSDWLKRLPRPAATEQPS